MKAAIILPHVAVNIVVFTLCDHELKVCLISGENGSWRLPGGSVRIDESLEDAAARLLDENTGVDAAFLQQLYTFGDPDRDPALRTVSVVYFALVSTAALPDGSETDSTHTTGWQSVYKLPTLTLDHAEIVEYALTRLRYKIEYSAVAFALLPEEFTLRELQCAYEIILDDQRLDKANFRKKLRDAEILEAVPRYKETGGRPAKLFRFRKDAQLEIKTRRFFP
jgi:8-oxo-dGTP diphosphatase